MTPTRVKGDVADTYVDLRPLLFSIAYRMLASVSEAEDVVQEAFVRYQRALANDTVVESPKAYLSAVVTRLAIDHLKSARLRRETYIGEWLPEPLVTDEGAGDPAANAEQADTLSMSFLLLLEGLTPVERAVFLLHDVFGYGYDEVAALVDRNEANCRQLALRARRHIESEKPRFDASRKERDALVARFFAAVGDGDLEGLIEILATDVVVYGDGGGKAPQWTAPIVGVERVARLLAGIGGQLHELGITIHPRRVNGQPGAVFLDRKGRLTNVWSLEVVDRSVQTVRSVINPDKLQHLGPVADVRVLQRMRRHGEEPA